MKLEISGNCSTANLEINTSKAGFHKIPIETEKAAGLVVKLSVPIIDIAAYWTPDCMSPDSKLRWSIEFNSAANKNFPFICFFNRKGENKFSVGLNELSGNIKIAAKMNQEKSTYDITFTYVDKKFNVMPEIYVSRENKHWTKTLRQYCDKLIDGKKTDYPDAAWEPVFCTWYAVHADFTQNWIEKNAEAAAKAGFKTFILDDGWCIDTHKKVSPETISEWYNEIGTWTFSNKKFSDVKNHIEKVRKYGLKYLVWIAPFMCGTKVDKYDRFAPDAYMKRDTMEGYRLLNIENEGVYKELLKYFSELMSLGLDGLKIDFLDEISKTDEFSDGAKVESFLKDLHKVITKNDKNALIEYRQKYSTPATMEMATQFRAGDVPYDYLENFNRTVSIRAMMGDGVPVHADPAYWNFDDLPETVSMHMLCAMAGVPMLSMDLEKMPESQLKIVKHWLTFYSEHMEIFKKGKWELRNTYGGFDFVSVTFKDTTIAYLLSEDSLKYLKGREGRIYALNLSPYSLNINASKVYDYTGVQIQSAAIPSACYGILD